MEEETPEENQTEASSALNPKLPDFEPPQASVQRIIKAALPPNATITKESKAAFSKAAGIFILYLSACANDFCADGKRSTISSADVVNALKELDLTDMVPQLDEFLEAYRREAGAKKEGSKKDDDGAADM